MDGMVGEVEGRWLGANVRRLREARGLSQGALAAAMRCQQQDVSALELGKAANVTLRKLAALSEALGVELAALLAPGEAEPNRRTLPSLHGRFDFSGPARFPAGVLDGEGTRMCGYDYGHAGGGELHICWLVDYRYPVRLARHYWWGLADLGRPDGLPSGYNASWLALDRDGVWHLWDYETRFGEGTDLVLADWIPFPGEQVAFPFEAHGILGGEAAVKVLSAPGYAQRVAALVDADEDDPADDPLLAAIFCPEG